MDPSSLPTAESTQGLRHKAQALSNWLATTNAVGAAVDMVCGPSLTPVAADSLIKDLFLFLLDADVPQKGAIRPEQRILSNMIRNAMVVMGNGMPSVQFVNAVSGHVINLAFVPPEGSSSHLLPAPLQRLRTDNTVVTTPRLSRESSSSSFGPRSSPTALPPVPEDLPSASVFSPLAGSPAAASRFAS